MQKRWEGGESIFILFNGGPIKLPETQSMCLAMAGPGQGWEHHRSRHAHKSLDLWGLSSVAGLPFPYMHFCVPVPICCRTHLLSLGVFSDPMTEDWVAALG